MMTSRREIEPVVPPCAPDSENVLPVEELATLFIAGALNEVERFEVERRLVAGDEALLAAVRSWDDVVEALGSTLEAVTPDPRIKAALLSRIAPVSRAAPEQADLSAPVSVNRALAAPSQIVRHADGAVWRSAGAPGASVRVLNADRKQGRMTTLMRIDPGCHFPEHPHVDEEECLVISGDLIDGDLTLGPGDYVRSAAGTHHSELTTRTGCECLVMSFRRLTPSEHANR